MLLCVLSSLVIVDTVYISDVVPKTYYDEDREAYFISVTACVQVLSAPTSDLRVDIDARPTGLTAHVVGVSYITPPPWSSFPLGHTYSFPLVTPTPPHGHTYSSSLGHTHSSPWSHPLLFPWSHPLLPMVVLTPPPLVTPTPPHGHTHSSSLGHTHSSPWSHLLLPWSHPLLSPWSHPLLFPPTLSLPVTFLLHL